MNVVDLISKQFGITTTYKKSPTISLVADTKTRIMEMNPRRLGFVLTNTGGVPLIVGPDSDITATKGIYLVGYGGTLTTVWNADFELPTMEWYAIAVGDATTIYVLEVLTE